MAQLRLATLKDGRKAIIIRTSDRIAFKKCRRSWAWSSHLKRNLGSKYLALPLWFGSAIHYALEDYHGYNYFGRPSRAFAAYCIATAKQHNRDLPDDAQEGYDLGIRMMDYYVDHWLRFRRHTPTYWAPESPTGDAKVDAGGYGPLLPGGEPNPDFHDSWIPQVEVNFSIPIPLDQFPTIAEYAKRQGADCVLYNGTIDRVGIEEHGTLTCVEYKTAKRPENFHFQTDPQITTYLWAMSNIYTRPIGSITYYQFVKHDPVPPRILGNGKISTASNLVSSGTLYRSALEKMYGPNEGIWPVANKEKLTELMLPETEHKDRFVQRDIVRRNNHMIQAEAEKILLEVEDMINPDLPLYPNPTRDGCKFCSFSGACVTMDDGGDWEHELSMDYSERDQAPDRMWRRRIPSTETMLKLMERQESPDLLGVQKVLRDMNALDRARIEAGEDPMNIPTFRW